MNYIAPRKMFVSSTCGRSGWFLKGVPTYAPPMMHKDLIALGIVPETEIDEPETVEKKEPVVPAERETALMAAFDKIVQRGRREDFMANGAPHSKVIALELGWGEIHNKERDAAWKKWTLLQTETT